MLFIERFICKNWCFKVFINITLFLIGSFNKLEANSGFKVIFRLDDCYLNIYGKEEQIIYLFKKHRIPLNVGIIPFRNDIDLNDSIELKKAYNLYHDPLVEIIQHGYAHRKRSEGEFDGLHLDEQRNLILKGKYLIEKHLGKKVITFAPPWNSYDKNTLTVLVDLNYKIISGNIFGNKSNSQINYIPATAYKTDDLYELMQTRPQGLCVMLLHPYEFQSERDFKNLDSLLGLIKINAIKCSNFSEMNKEEKPSRIRLLLHRHPLFSFLSQRNFAGFTHKIYYSNKILISFYIAEWLILASLLVLFFHIFKNGLKLPLSVSIILLLLGLALFAIATANYTNSSNWIIIQKTAFAFTTAVVINIYLLKKVNLKAARATYRDSPRASFHKPS